MEEKKYEIGLACGQFDFLHEGHIKYLLAAKNMCGHLIIGVNSDSMVEWAGKISTHSFEERVEQVKNLGLDDNIIPYHLENLADIQKAYNVDVWFLSEEYKEVFGQKDVEGIMDLVYMERTPGVSSSQIRKNLAAGLVYF